MRDLALVDRTYSVGRHGDHGHRFPRQRQEFDLEAPTPGMLEDDRTDVAGFEATLREVSLQYDEIESPNHGLAPFQG